MKGPRHITDAPIDLNRILAGAHHPAAGGIVLFSGEARNHNEGRDVKFLEYEAHVSLADKMIAAILDEAGQRFPLETAHCMHRVGRVGLTESAVVVVTAGAHRGEAYDANRYIIDRVKLEVPIWKCEHYVDGESRWGRNCEHGPGLEHTHEQSRPHGHPQPHGAGHREAGKYR